MHVAVRQQQRPPQAVAPVKAVLLCVVHLNLRAKWQQSTAHHNARDQVIALSTIGLLVSSTFSWFQGQGILFAELKVHS